MVEINKLSQINSMSLLSNVMRAGSAAVDNAGAFLVAAAQDTSVETFSDTVAVNLTAPYLLSKAVLPDMLARGWGRIIVVASINGKMTG